MIEIPDPRSLEGGALAGADAREPSADATPPPKDGLGHVTAALGWVFGRLSAYIDRFAFRFPQADGGLDGLHVSMEEARARLSPTTVDRYRAGLGLHLAFEVDALPDDPRLRTLSERLMLSDLEVRLFVAAAAPALSVDISRLYRFAWADFTRRVASVGFLCELVCDAPIDALAAHRLFDPSAPLRRSGLLRLDDGGLGDGHVALIEQGVIASPIAVRWWRAEPLRFDPAWRRCTRLRAARPVTRGAVGYGEHRAGALTDRLVGLLARLDGSDGTRIALIGRRGCGRAAAIADAFARGTSTIELDAEWLADDPRMASTIALAANLEQAAVVLRIDSGPRVDEECWIALTIALDVLLRGPLFFLVSDVAPRLRRAVPRLIELTVPSDEPATQVRRWRDALGGLVAESDDGERAPVDIAACAERLVQRFDLTVGVIERVTAAVRPHIAPGFAEDELVDALSQAVWQSFDHALGSVAERVTKTLTWADVVLPDEVLTDLHEICHHARFKHVVFSDWGFGRKMTYGKGLACLFYGPPGTGKTMVAGVISHDLGLPLYRVDLSRVISKWIGETEKNLARVFDEAERAQAMLLFDEADSLFSKRTEVKGSNDRFANTNVNFLLQRMEAFEGLSILTSNFEQGLDDALKRRLRFRVHFPLPDADLREQIWRAAIPPSMPVEPDLPFALLGKRFKFSGGHIKNAALRAAFYAAGRRAPLSRDDLLRGADAELRGMGRL